VAWSGGACVPLYNASRANGSTERVVFFTLFSFSLSLLHSEEEVLDTSGMLRVVDGSVCCL